MKILRKITVTLGCTEGKEVERYTCSKCRRIEKEISTKKREYTRKKLAYSKLIFIKKCNSCIGRHDKEEN
ncbi:hypothetical protein [Clostridium paraputrificum]|uniref:hypothetical protein n=1 Tax=Clostridium paraputrificum TaxID=29363 RepID=UPI001896DFFC|nr:hypothetical protein [Clostridium paraputrificum]